MNENFQFLLPLFKTKTSVKIIGKLAPPFVPHLLVFATVTRSPFGLHERTTICTRSSSNTNGVKYEVPRCKTTSHQRWFWIRTIRTWNTLTDIIDLSMKNVNAFKSLMRDYYNTSLRNTCDGDDARTFKTICSRCNRGKNYNCPYKLLLFDIVYM